MSAQTTRCSLGAASPERGPGATGNGSRSQSLWQPSSLAGSPQLLGSYPFPTSAQLPTKPMNHHLPSVLPRSLLASGSQSAPSTRSPPCIGRNVTRATHETGLSSLMNRTPAHPSRPFSLKSVTSWVPGGLLKHSCRKRSGLRCPYAGTGTPRGGRGRLTHRAEVLDPGVQPLLDLPALLGSARVGVDVAVVTGRQNCRTSVRTRRGLEALLKLNSAHRRQSSFQGDRAAREQGAARWARARHLFSGGAGSLGPTPFRSSGQAQPSETRWKHKHRNNTQFPL